MRCAPRHTLRHSARCGQRRYLTGQASIYLTYSDVCTGSGTDVARGALLADVVQAREAAERAQARYRAAAVDAVRGGAGKSAVARAADVARTTLDAWIAASDAE